MLFLDFFEIMIVPKPKKCDEGHLLKKRYGNPYAQMGAQVECDNCQTALNVKERDKGFWSCEECMMDACHKCMKP